MKALIEVRRETAATLWGYATHVHITGTSIELRHRTDTVLPPLLTPDEFATFHDHVRAGDLRARRRMTHDTGLPTIRRALREAIDVRTSSIDLSHVDPHDPTSTSTTQAIIHALVTLDGASLESARHPLARELLWAAIAQARAGRAHDAREAVAALNALKRAHRRS
ncbi:hypothetical protein [Cellulosimicrobium composti]|uniref:hypothetical protein n=1 Tax=Cellulosimicrobium composti TaxID=2672572 RepID=UPI003796797E